MKNLINIGIPSKGRLRKDVLKIFTKKKLKLIESLRYKKVNKKMYHGAMQAILSELARSSRLLVVEELLIDTPKTKILVKKLKELSLEKVTIVVDKLGENLLLAARNIKDVEVVEVSDLNPINLIGAEKVLFTLPAIKKAEELFS